MIEFLLLLLSLSFPLFSLNQIRIFPLFIVSGGRRRKKKSDFEFPLSSFLSASSYDCGEDGDDLFSKQATEILHCLPTVVFSLHIIYPKIRIKLNWNLIYFFLFIFGVLANDVVFVFFLFAWSDNGKKMIVLPWLFVNKELRSGVELNYVSVIVTDFFNNFG